MLIQVDVDSTLYDSSALFSYVAKKHYDFELPPNQLNWHGYYNYAPASELVKVFRKAHSKEYVARQIPYEGAADVLEEIQSRGHDIFYVSDRHPQAVVALKEWLDTHNFLHGGHSNVIVGKDKRQWMRDHKPDIVIDDRVRTMMLARFELGSTVFSIAHPWNANLRNEVDGIYICENWSQLGSEIDKYL